MGPLDEKYITMKKPMKYRTEYYNYKGFFSLVLLAVAGAEYRFLWVDVRSSGSSSNAQIFNQSKMGKKISDGTLRLPPPQPLGVGVGQICTISCLVMMPLTLCHGW